MDYQVPYTKRPEDILKLFDLLSAQPAPRGAVEVGTIKKWGFPPASAGHLLAILLKQAVCLCKDGPCKEGFDCRNHVMHKNVDSEGLNVKSQSILSLAVSDSRSFTQEKIGGRINAGICQKDDYQKSIWSQACSRWCYSMQRLPL